MSIPVSQSFSQEPMTILPPELHPSVEHLIIEDGKRVDGLYSEKQMRLLTRPLYSSWAGPAGDSRFVALANVGMFFAVNQPPLVPDVLLSLGVQFAADLSQKRNNSYFFWEFGKGPEAVVEVVSNSEGGELSTKKADYARIRIPVYVVWDPFLIISDRPLHTFGLQIQTYEEISPDWFESLGLGLKVWHGSFESSEADWLRWCDHTGQLIPLGEERAEQERHRAEQERQRAEQERQRAEQERQRAEQERQRAEQAEQRVERLRAQMRRLGIEPSNGNEKDQPGS